MLKENFIKRFHTRYTVSESGCWEWQHATNTQGYASIKLIENGKTIWMGHRVSYHLFNGSIPEGAYILHKCDNPCCVNPEHLKIGDAQSNMDDMVAKGRQQRKGRPYLGGYQRPLSSKVGHNYNKKQSGSDNSQSKLTDREVGEIRVHLGNGKTLAKIARAYGVGTSTIHRIKHKHSWK